MEPRHWLARCVLLLTAFTYVTHALRFAENEWDMRRGQPLNISWLEANGDVNIGIYLARKVPGRAELQLNLNLTAEDQNSGFIIWDVPNTFVDGLYQFNVWGDGTDYRLHVMGDAESVFSSSGLSTGAKAAIAVGVLIILSAILAAVLYVLRRRGIINTRDGHTALTSPEPDAFHDRSASTPKPTPGYHHAAQVSGDHTCQDVGGTTTEMGENNGQAYRQPHIDPSPSQSQQHYQTEHYDDDHGTSYRHSQAISNMSKPPEYGRSPPQSYSVAHSQPDHQEYAEFPTIPHRFSQRRGQRGLPAYGPKSLDAGGRPTMMRKLALVAGGEVTTRTS